MSTKFSQFLEDNKVNQRRILAASQAIEKLRPEDRKLKLTKRQGKKKEGGDKESQPATKPRSGRPVTERLLSAAVAGKPIPGPAKTRLLRAVNRILEQKKRDAIDLRALF